MERILVVALWCCIIGSQGTRVTAAKVTSAQERLDDDDASKLPERRNEAGARQTMPAMRARQDRRLLFCLKVAWRAVAGFNCTMERGRPINWQHSAETYWKCSSSIARCVRYWTCCSAFGAWSANGQCSRHVACLEEGSPVHVYYRCCVAVWRCLCHDCAQRWSGSKKDMACGFLGDTPKCNRIMGQRQFLFEQTPAWFRTLVQPRRCMWCLIQLPWVAFMAEASDVMFGVALKYAGAGFELHYWEVATYQLATFIRN